MELQPREREHVARVLSHPTMWDEIAQTGLPEQAITFAQNRMRYMLDNNRMLDNRDMSAAHGVPEQETRPEFATCENCGEYKGIQNGQRVGQNGGEAWEKEE